MNDKKHYIRVERHKWADEIAEEKKITRKKFTSFIICVLCFVLGVGTSAVAFSAKSQQDSSSQSKFNTIYDLMMNEWYFGKDIEDLDTYLLNNAIYGLTTNEYDIHTNYMDEEKAASYLQKLEGSVVGIGITMTMLDEDAMITRVYASSPAQKAGLQKGDIIRKIDGISVAGKTIDEIASLTKGEAGTKVSYVVERDGEMISMEMTRASVSASAYGYMSQNTAVLDIESVSENTDEEVETYLKNFKEQNAERLIIDLRANTGGYVDTVIRICSLFMEKGKTVFYEQDRDGNISEHKTRNSNIYTFDKIVILMDENTASAAEVMASCLKTHLNATLVGTTTYGKGTVQVSKQFTDGSYIKYTIGEWLTAEKKSINGVGIEPDVQVELDAAITTAMSTSSKTYTLDSVGDLVKDAQVYLRFLGYNVDRVDGYFSQSTLNAVHAYQKANGMTQTDTIDQAFNEELFNDVGRKWILEQEKLDDQLLKAIEIVNQ